MSHPDWLTLKQAGDHCSPPKSKDTIERRRDDGALPSARQRPDANGTWEVHHDDLLAHGWCACDPLGLDDDPWFDDPLLDPAPAGDDLAAERARREALEEQLADLRGEVHFLRGLVDRLAATPGVR